MLTLFAVALALLHGSPSIYFSRFVSDKFALLRFALVIALVTALPCFALVAALHCFASLWSLLYLVLLFLSFDFWLHLCVALLCYL